MNLDPRQRAMLAEMGVKLWWPATPATAVADPAPAASAAPASAIATKNIAENPHQYSRNTLKNPENRHASAHPEPRTVAQPAVASAVAAMDWPSLQAAVAACEACGLCKTRRNTVFGVGQAATAAGQAPQVDWLIVGEAPGEHEDMQGEPFVGAAGKLLDNMLKAMGCSRHHNVYIANVLKCRPPGNRNPAPDEIAQCTPYLERQVALLQPKVIVAMGRFAAQTVLAHSVPEVHAMPLGKLRGQVFRYQGIPVIATYHPAYLLRSLPEKAKSWADLCLAMAVMDGAVAGVDAEAV